MKIRLGLFYLPALPQTLKRGTGITGVLAFIGIACFFSALPTQQLLGAENNAIADGRLTKSPDLKLQKTLDQVDRTLTLLKKELEKNISASKERDTLKSLHNEISSIDKEVLKDFDRINTFIDKNKLPSVIVDRQTNMVHAYKSRMNKLRRNIGKLETAGDRENEYSYINETNKLLESYKEIDRARKFDPKNLPSRSMQPNRKIIPRTKRSEFIRSGLFSTPTIKVAAIGNFSFDKLPDASNPAYLSQTPEVQLSPLIIQKANELNHDPVKIYNWVHDNIKWIPTWGSLQGAEQTYLNQKGNSIDISSLLIALYRASGIPARYVHGTIEVKPEQLKNWVGGFTDLNSMWDYVSSGGIPVTGVRSGGRIIAFRLEHIWVEAAIDYHPSRGTINKSADSWIALDPSLKKNIVVPGEDFTQLVAFDSSTYLSQLREENPIEWYMNTIQTYIGANSLDKTLSDIMGYQVVDISERNYLSSGLPYKILLAANKYSSLPASLQTNIEISLHDTGQIDPEVVSLKASEIIGKRLSLVYEPATSGDQAIVDAYGGDMYAVPAYLLYLAPVLKVDGNIIYKGNPIQMGMDQSLAVSYATPSYATKSIPHTLTSGGYYAIGLNIQGINSYILGTKNIRLHNTLARTDIQNISYDDLIGEHLYALILQYFQTNDGFYEGASKIYNVATSRAPSAGIAGIGLTVSYYFGIPRSAVPNKAQIDVGLEAIQAASKDGNADKLKKFLELRGLMGSFSEHAIWERIHGFNSVSAVKIIQISHESGIPVYSIDQNNVNQILPQLSIDLADVQEIQQGVQNGLVAIVPQHELTIDNWTGTGFILKDPVTSVGVYRISGGLSGGATTSAIDGLQIVSIFKGPFSWLKDKLDLFTRGALGLSAAAEANVSELGDEELDDAFGYFVRQGVLVWSGTKYEQVGRCTGFVIRVYNSAGIDLMMLGKKNGGLNPRSVVQMKKLAQALNINNSVRNTNDPLIGDVVFFDHTYDRNRSCSLADDDQPTHVGIVTRVDKTNPARIEFAHAGTVAKDGIKMARDDPSNGKLNGVLVRAWKCVPCRNRIKGDYPDIDTTKFSPDCGAGYCSNQSALTCGRSDFPYISGGKIIGPHGVYAGEKFSGYATFRDTGQ